MTAPIDADGQDVVVVPPIRLRAPSHRELPRLRQIEVAAARRFRDSPHPEVAGMPPTELALLRNLAAEEGLLVAADARNNLLGFALYMPMEGDLYLAELNVLPEAAGRRIGAGLIDSLTEIGARRGCRWLLLTTFRRVLWNAPYYRRLGFEEIPRAELSPALAAEMARQSARGLRLASRVAMRRRCATAGARATLSG